MKCACSAYALQYKDNVEDTVSTKNKKRDIENPEPCNDFNLP